MEIEQLGSVEFKVSKTGETVPYINGIYLHSMIDPMEEALSFAKVQESKLKENSNVLVLGLGYGYHIETVVSILEKYHNQSYNLKVIEPSNELVKIFISDDHQGHSIANIKNIDIISRSVENIYLSEKVIRFLLESPVVLIHKPSYQANKDYFSSFLKHEPSIRSKEVIQNLNRSVFNEVKNDILKSESIKDYVHNFSDKKEMSRSRVFADLLQLISGVKNEK